MFDMVMHWIAIGMLLTVGYIAASFAFVILILLSVWGFMLLIDLTTKVAAWFERTRL